jgi:predicted nucleotidyltransferase
MRRVVSIRLDEGTWKAARDRARAERRTLTNYIEGLLQEQAPQWAGQVAFQAIATLRAKRGELEAMGVRHVAVFGSVARGEESPESDIDLLIETDPTRFETILAYGGLQVRLEQWFTRAVDVSDRAYLPQHVIAAADAEKLIAF